MDWDSVKDIGLTNLEDIKSEGDYFNIPVYIGIGLRVGETISRGNRFVCALQVPSGLPWTNVVVRAYAASAGDSALGVAVLPVGK